MRSSSGFTLIEVVISGSLMAVILTSAYLCLHAALTSQKLIEPRSEAIQSARVALSLLCADLRNACPLSKEYSFLGMNRSVGDMEADNLDFATHNYTPRRMNEGDFCELSYFTDKDPQSGQYSLWRRRNPGISQDPLSGGRREEIVRGLKGIRFEYYDGYEWFDTWGDLEAGKKSKVDKTTTKAREKSNLDGMPEAVRITLWMDPNLRGISQSAASKGKAEPPLVFQTVARLNLASSSTAGDASSSAPDQSPAVPPNPTPGGGP